MDSIKSSCKRKCAEPNSESNSHSQTKKLCSPTKSQINDLCSQTQSENNLEKRINQTKSSITSIKATQKADSNAKTIQDKSYRELEGELNELTIDEIYKLASEKKFPEKLFIFSDCRKSYTERLNFFTSVREFDRKRKEVTEDISFTCKICNKIQHASFGNVSNLNAHLKQHKEFREKWLNIYDEFSSKSKFKELDDDTYDLIRMMVSTNLPLAVFENDNFAKCLRMELTSVKTFRYTKLPKCFEQMKKIIDSELSNAKTISLITDIWTNKIMADYLALACIYIDKNYKEKLLVLGLSEMDGSHNAENIKIVIEKIINNYAFDKRKIKSECYLNLTSLP